MARRRHGIYKQRLLRRSSRSDWSFRQEILPNPAIIRSWGAWDKSLALARLVSNLRKDTEMRANEERILALAASDDLCAIPESNIVYRDLVAGSPPPN